MGAAALCLAFAGCGSDDEESNAAGAGGGGGGGQEEVTIGFVPKSLEGTFWQANRDGAEKAAASGQGIKVEVDAGASEAAVEEQIAKVENMIVRGVDGLAVAPTAPDQLLPVLQRAAQEGIPVTVVDTDMPKFSQKTAFVGTNNIKGGELAADYIKKELGGKGTVGLITGSPGVTSVEDRIKGVRQGLEGSGLKIVTELRARDCTRDNGVSAMEDLLTAHPEVSAVFAACGEPLVGGLQAVKAAGIKPADILLVGFDASPDEVAAIQAGDQDASVAQFPQNMGEQSVLAAAKVARGGTVEKVIDTGTEVVTKENAAKFAK